MEVESFKFSDKDKEDLRSIDPALKILESDIAKAKNVGIDVSAQEKEIAGIRKLRDGLLKKF
jgi:hypothetical protein